MLDTVVAHYMTLSWWSFLSLHLGAVILGGGFSALRVERQFELYRAPYFAASESARLLIWVPKFSSLVMIDAIENDVAWMIVASNFALFVSVGYVTGVIGAARSRNAFGHSKAAFLAFIPGVHLYLYFVRARDTAPAHSWITPAPFRGSRGVTLGLLCLLTINALDTFVFDDNRKFVNPSELSRREKIAFADFLIDGLGLPGALRVEGANLDMSRVPDRYTVERRYAIQNSVFLVYNAPGGRGSIEDDKSWFVSWICRKYRIRLYLKRGADWNHVFRLPDGSKTTIRIDEETCGNVRQN